MARPLQFYLQMDAKSVITQPAPELKLQGPGLYKISGLAWSGRGRGIVRKVEVSAERRQELGRSCVPVAGAAEGAGALFRCPGAGMAGPRSCRAAAIR